MSESTLNKDITVLVVDDDPLVQKIVEASLMKENYKILFASDGETGLKMAHEVCPDLVLLDVVMPGIDGFEVCTRMRKDERLRFTPIIILTALDDRDSKVQGLEAGADDYICKPFDKLEFRARVKTVTRLNRTGDCREIEKLSNLLMEKDKLIEQLNQEIINLKAIL